MNTPVQPVADALLLAAARVTTYNGEWLRTNASGFFFEREGRLYLVTSRHVVIDEAAAHRPDRLVIELHTDAGNLTQSTGYSIPLYRGASPVWKQGRDQGGDVDVAAIEIDRERLPPTTVLRAFGPDHLLWPAEGVEIGASMLIVGFPLGFHDALHRLAVARRAVLASAWGLRFQGEGYFLTDARTHRGSSGAPVVLRLRQPPTAPTQHLPWALLGVHAASVDMADREKHVDEALGLSCAWYADILMALTAGDAVGA